MTRSIQKSKESWYMNRLQSVLKRDLDEDFPTGPIRSCERPDFLVMRPTGTLGIEFTDFARCARVGAAHSEAEEAGFWRKIVRDAGRLCEKGGVPPLYVTVYVIGPLGRVRGIIAQRVLSEKLAAFVEEWSSQSPRQYETLEPGDAVPGITRVGVTRLDDSHPHEWKWSSGGTVVAPVTVEPLQERLTAKEANYQVYRTRCSECWLTIACDRNDPAMAADIEIWPETMAFEYQSSFDRVFFLQLSWKLVALHLVRR